MRVIKRKKGSKEYYYLQHSFRIKGKVVTREKYLGKEIPVIIEEIKKAFEEKTSKQELYKKLEKIKQGFQKEWKKYPESIKNKIKKQISIELTYNTNAIEGSTITLEETREIIEDQIAPNKPLKDVKETESHSELFLKILKNKEKISIKTMIKWHKELFKDTKQDIAGIIREYNVRVGNHTAPDWQEIKKLLKKLIDFYKKNKETNPVELAAKTHYQFEKIHPFGDGNGRIGRLIINNTLWSAGYPMLIIEYKKRKGYYKALQKDEEKFFNYFARKYLKVHSKYLK
ncbi:MAG: Fic family protein [Nanoarchaeota archaeon]|nr:Fic family protein [Nanoarchaeota archaeon]MBU1321049.1 Fic family protein [Nanoarchaeota archaeon]MBU1598118.1 Fic family protein [Nanoarchaeota archaeon]MBU2442318.1 Fic family protein [Nanoarchaeota archaeon]